MREWAVQGGDGGWPAESGKAGEGRGRGRCTGRAKGTLEPRKGRPSLGGGSPWSLRFAGLA